MVALCVQSCSTTRSVSAASGSRVQVSSEREARDSLREEILQNRNENLSEHEVVTWTVTGFLRPAGSRRAELERPLTASCAPLVLRRASSESGLQERDTLKVERVTHRELESGSRSTVHGSWSEVKTLTVRDTVYIEQRDTVLVEKNRSFSNGTNQSGKSALHGTLKWIFAIIVALIGLIITVKVCLRKAS